MSFASRVASDLSPASVGRDIVRSGKAVGRAAESVGKAELSIPGRAVRAIEGGGGKRKSYGRKAAGRKPGWGATRIGRPMVSRGSKRA